MSKVSDAGLGCRHSKVDWDKRTIEASRKNESSPVEAGDGRRLRRKTAETKHEDGGIYLERLGAVGRKDASMMVATRGQTFAAMEEGARSGDDEATRRVVLSGDEDSPSVDKYGLTPPSRGGTGREGRRDEAGDKTRRLREEMRSGRRSTRATAAAVARTRRARTKSSRPTFATSPFQEKSCPPLVFLFQSNAFLPSDPRDVWLKELHELQIEQTAASFSSGSGTAEGGTGGVFMVDDRESLYGFMSCYRADSIHFLEPIKLTEAKMLWHLLALL